MVACSQTELGCFKLIQTTNRNQDTRKRNHVTSRNLFYYVSEKVSISVLMFLSMLSVSSSPFTKVLLKRTNLEVLINQLIFD